MSREQIGKATFQAVIVNWFPLHAELLQLRISLPESSAMRIGSWSLAHALAVKRGKEEAEKK